MNRQYVGTYAHSFRTHIHKPYINLRSKSTNIKSSLITYLNHLTHITGILNHFGNIIIYFFNTLLCSLKVQTTKIQDTNITECEGITSMS